MRTFMTSNDFCYWLKGFIELNEPEALNTKHLAVIKKHINSFIDNEDNPSSFSLFLDGYLKLSDPKNIEGEAFEKILTELDKAIVKIEKKAEQKQAESHYERPRDLLC
jgi:hypothetical protein